MNVKRNGEVCWLLHNKEWHIQMPRNYVAEMGYQPVQHVDTVMVEYKLSPTMKLRNAWGV